MKLHGPSVFSTISKEKEERGLLKEQRKTSGAETTVNRQAQIAATDQLPCNANGLG